MVSENLASELPKELAPEVTNTWSGFQERAPEQAAGIAANVELRTALERCWACSRFARDVSLAQPEFITAELAVAADEETLNESLAGLFEEAAKFEQGHEQGLVFAQRGLRRLRNREQLRIAWRDINGSATVPETLAATSQLAIAILRAAIPWAEQQLYRRFGHPLSRAGEVQRLAVLGMGKLGAGELNFSSDIDLILLYGEPGATDGLKSLDNGEFFARVAKLLIKLLGELTADGFVYRVDFRLRPFGEQGPLAMHIDQTEHYYETHGRDWERYALIKATAVAGDESLATKLLGRLRPFIYRRYLDFNGFAALREMQEMIFREVERKGLDGNIKLGAGGIRSVEFVVQSFQLLYGGRNAALRAPPLLPALQEVVEQELMPAAAAEKLREAYFLLRKAENRLQMLADQQTHDLPTSDLEQTRLAYAMGFNSWPACSQLLAERQQLVAKEFGRVFGAPDSSATNPSWAATVVEHRRDDDTTAIESLQGAGFEEGSTLLARLNQFCEGSVYLSLENTGRERIDSLLPLLLERCATMPTPDLAFARSIPVVEAIARRIAFYSLLIESPIALENLVALCTASPWISDELARMPALLAELVDMRELGELPEKLALAMELNERLADGEADVEFYLDELRRFQHAAMLRIAAADINANLPLMNVSDRLSELAELMLEKALCTAQQQLAPRYGEPQIQVGGTTATAPFCIIAYGKLGGWELGYGSDLDVVFLHGSKGSNAATNGAKSIDNATYFSRLGQRLINALSAQTAAGRAYEVDTRLRPSGESGALVASINGFTDYQRERAWTWEHQALVRARAVVGDAALINEFEGLRREILCRPRDASALQTEVADMRQRMRAELDSSNDEVFDLKQGVGGIADIEFVVQYAVLRWANEHPRLTRWTDNIRLLQTLAEEKLLPETEAESLISAYQGFRHAMHRQRLQRNSGQVADTEFQLERQTVAARWAKWLG